MDIISRTAIIHHDNAPVMAASLSLFMRGGGGGGVATVVGGGVGMVVLGVEAVVVEVVWMIYASEELPTFVM